MADLISAHLAHSNAHAPETSNHTLSHSEMAAVQLWAICEGEAVLGCVGLKAFGDGLAEVKSLHIAKAARGRGFSKRLMQHLISDARAQGLLALVLETGSDQLTGYDAARALYVSLGFSSTGPIPGYEQDPASAFFRLDLV